MEKCCWNRRIHWQLHLARKMLLFLTSHVFSYATVWVWDFMCVFVSTMLGGAGFEGVELRGWQRAEGFDWLACDYSGCQVFTKRRWWWGGGQRQLLSLCTLNHTHRHTHDRTYTEGCSCTGNPTSPAVCMCVCATAGRWDQWLRLTGLHTPGPPQLQLSMVQAECVARLVDSDWPGQLREVMHRGLIA